jgi:nitrogen fixation/metabolism regulation signal transduction histidine kinase
MRSLFLLGTTVAVMVLFGLLSSHKLAGPVVSLERHLRAVADGNYESRVTFRKKDNLDDFAQGLNQMAEAIENRRNRARQIAAEIWRRCEGLPSGSDSPSFLADAERLIARYKEAL